MAAVPAVLGQLKQVQLTDASDLPGTDSTSADLSARRAALDQFRVRFAGHRAAALRPRPGDAADYAVRVALREVGRRVEFPDAQIERLDDLIIPLVTARHFPMPS
jgi:hypothetical protein